MSLRSKRHVGAAAATGLPPKPPEMSWRDYLVMLLHVAAEIEHALMVEYLYAAYSLGGAGVGKHATKVRGWHDELLTVAREEMGHLVCVQNALLLLGAPISFEREDYPWSGPFNAFPFELEPFRLESLAKYVYSEMPALDALRGPDLEVGRKVEALVGPSAGPRVGEIYERLIALVEDTRKIPETAFHPESYAAQADWDEWGRSYRPRSHAPYDTNVDIPPPGARKTTVIVARVATRTELAAALRTVAAQGEAEHLGKQKKAAPSHFDRFAQIFREYEEILAEEPGFVPSRPVPVNPIVASEGAYAREGSTPITAPRSSAWAGLFNVRYRMLLTLLTYACSGPRESPELAALRRAPVISRIFGEMYNLKAIAGVLVRLPRTEPETPERAGPPFQMPYTLTLPQPERNFWSLELDLLDASEELAKGLLRDGGGSGSPDGIAYLQALREADAEARAWIEDTLGLGRRRSRGGKGKRA